MPESTIGWIARHRRVSPVAAVFATLLVSPPVFTVESNAMDGVRALLVRHLKDLFGAPKVPVSAG